MKRIRVLKGFINKDGSMGKMFTSKIFKLSNSYEFWKVDSPEFALGNTKLVGRVRTNKKTDKDGSIDFRAFIRYNISDRFEDPTGTKMVEWGKKYGIRSKPEEITLEQRKFKNEKEFNSYIKSLQEKGRGR